MTLPIIIGICNSPRLFMIWLRRFISIPLILLLILFFQISATTHFAASNLITAQFYLDNLASSSVYSFLLNDVPLSVLDETRSNSDQPDISVALNTLDMSDKQIVDSLNRIVTPTWLQETVESQVNDVGNYLTNDVDEFTISISISDQTKQASEELKSLVRNSNLHDFIIDSQIKPLTTKAVQEEWPLGIRVSEDRLLVAIKAVATKQWVSKQADNALDEIIPYLVGEEDYFSFLVLFDDRIKIASSEFKSILRETDYYNLVYSELVSPVVKSAIGDITVLPHEVELSESEINDILKTVAPPEWVEVQAEYAIDELVAYLVGDKETLNFSIDISENKELAVDSFIAIAIEKFDEKLELLPDCSEQDLVTLLTSGNVNTLTCYPSESGMRSRIKNLTDQYRTDVLNSVRPRIIDSIPDEIELNESILEKQSISGGSVSETLIEIRKLIVDGWEFTDEDLETMLINSGGEKSWEQFQQVRTIISNGINYSNSDLEEDLIKSGNEQSIETIGLSRKYLGIAQNLKFFVYAPSTLLAIIIGLIGANTWSARLAWSSSAVIVASFVVWLVWGPIFNSTVLPVIEAELTSVGKTSLENIDQYNQTSSLVIAKIQEILVLTTKSLTEGIAKSGLATMFISFAVLGITIVWDILGRQNNLFHVSVSDKIIGYLAPKGSYAVSKLTGRE